LLALKLQKNYKNQIIESVKSDLMNMLMSRISQQQEQKLEERKQHKGIMTMKVVKMRCLAAACWTSNTVSK